VTVAAAAGSRSAASAGGTCPPLSSATSRLAGGVRGRLAPPAGGLAGFTGGDPTSVATLRRLARIAVFTTTAAAMQSATPARARAASGSPCNAVREYGFNSRPSACRLASPPA
jgi:hypothetical protein